MKRLIKYCKARPFDATIWALIGIGFLIVAYFVVIIFFPFNDDQFFGNRLVGIEQVPIENYRLEEIKEALTTGKVEEVSITIVGRTITITCLKSEAFTYEEYDKLAVRTKEQFTERELNFYDFQLIVALSDFEEQEEAPVFGYKNRDADTFSWTRNRSN